MYYFKLAGVFSVNECEDFLCMDSLSTFNMVVVIGNDSHTCYYNTLTVVFIHCFVIESAGMVNHQSKPETQDVECLS